MTAREDLDLSSATWRTSTYSNDGGNCVEVASAWRTSSHSNNGGDCVEVATRAQARVVVRDTKEHGLGQVHAFTAEEWQRFVAHVKAGAL